MSNLITVGLIDDHRLFREGLATILNAAEDMQVTLQANHGHELLNHLLTKPLPDVLLIDHEMPVMDGLQTLKALQNQYAEARVIILTMHHQDQFITHYMEAGACGFLVKDAHPAEVETAIKKVTNGERYFNDLVSNALLKGLKNKATGKTWQPDTGESLTERELEVLQGICNQQSTAEIADYLCLSPRTIEGYRKTLLEKTRAKNTAGLVMFAIRHGIIQPK